MTLTPQQKLAIEAEGNVLVVAGAGAGKTGTLVQRCIRLLLDQEKPVDIGRILVVTFTEAAAAEVRDRIRRKLDEAAELDPGNFTIQKQIAGLDSANISTLHSFCLSLIQEHFYDLDLDPALAVMAPEQAEMLFVVTFEELLNEHFLGRHEFSAELQEVLRTQFQGWDKRLLSLTRRIHHFTQTRPEPDRWFEAQLARLSVEGANEWLDWYAAAVREWCTWWKAYLGSLPLENENAHYCAELLGKLHETGNVQVLHELLGRNQCWPRRRKEEHSAPFGKFFEEVEFLEALAEQDAIKDDWTWSRGPMRTIVRFAQQFTDRYNRAKRERGAVDFHDLEQYALDLLWDMKAAGPARIAQTWRNRLEAVFVDEYQDINAVQDLIISAVSRDGAGNRFLVGDIKQSIYRFRQADPKIFGRYLSGESGWTRAVLSDNFRSHEGILDFINPLFAWLMQGAAGGIVYDDEARLRFGGREHRAEMASRPEERTAVELNLLITAKSAESESDEPELELAEREARLVATRLRELRESKFEIFHQKEKTRRAVEWKDMVVLLRAAAGKLEIYAKQFEAVGVPLQTKRDGFFTTPEVLDLVNVLTILDNPLQDIPLTAVLRSPLVGMSANDLAFVRGHSKAVRFWHALSEFLELKKDSPARAKIEQFLAFFHRWRNPRAAASLVQRLELILSDTGYADWLLTQPRGRQRYANVQQLLRVAHQFDESRGESLYLFLRHIQDLQEAAGDIEPAPSSEENAVRLMTVHQSKGLEFPVVAVADLGKTFNVSDQNSAILLHERYGICSAIQSPHSPQPYVSLPLWLSANEERMESRAEEMRVLYVALTRAENLLLLFGATPESRIERQWGKAAVPQPFPQQMLRLNSALDWLGAYLTWRWPGCFSESEVRLNDCFTIRRWESMPLTAERSDKPGPAWTNEQLEALFKKVSFTYPHSAATQQVAKLTVSAIRRRAAEADDEAPVIRAFGPAASTLGRNDDGRQRGLAMHTFLQHHTIAGQLDAEGLRAQAGTLVEQAILEREQVSLIDFDAIAMFWKSEFGREVRSRLLDLHRELPFTVKLSRSDLAAHKLEQVLPVPEGEFVVVQGIADLVLIGPKDIWLLDFKTDNIDPSELKTRAVLYRPQVALYAFALEKIYARPVKRSGLYFLALRETVFF